VITRNGIAVRGFALGEQGSKETESMGWALVHRIFEGKELVVEHRFFGRTKEDAHHIFEAHMKTDSFLRDCETKQHFRDFDCSTEWFWERTNR
jgi:hypothetical protein